MTSMSKLTPTEYREKAAEADRAAAESFDRCDTDGFLSQWANTITAQQHRLNADIVEQGGRSAFPALFDLDGNLVAAKFIPTRYGTAWGLLASDDPDAAITGWVNRSKAQDPARRAATLAQKGYTEGTVLAFARAKVCGSGTGLAGAANAYVAAVRTDGGFSRDVEIITRDANTDQANRHNSQEKSSE